MKRSALYIFVFAMLITSCNPGTENTSSANVEQVSSSGSFGAPVEEVNLMSTAQMFDALESQGEFRGKVIGEIKEVCVKKGCWMTMSLPDGQSMRITFKDYGFFVPTDSQGYPVIIEGTATKSVIDVETLKHYAEDAGKSKEEIESITSPKEEYAFEAVGVIIKENA